MLTTLINTKDYTIMTRRKHSKKNNSCLNSKKENTYIKWLVLIITFITIFTLNQLTYYTSDDYTYHYVYKGHMPTTDIEKIDGIGSIVTSQINHYHLWNGRYLAHSIVQFFLQYDKIIFNIFNTFAFILLMYLIYAIIETRSSIKKPGMLLAQIAMLLWLMIPSFGQTVLWVSGAGNYLWTSLFYTGFLLLYLKNLDDHLFVILGSIFLGFLTGVTNENSGPATILVAVCIFLLNIIINKKIKIYQITGILFSVLGFISMMSSAGSQKRGHIDLSIEVLSRNLTNIFTNSMIHFYFFYLLILVLILILSLLKAINAKDIYFIILLLIGHFACIYSLILVSEQPLRVLFGASVYLVIVTTYLLNRLRKLKKSQFILTVGLLLFSAYHYYNAIQDNRTTYSQVMEQVALLKNASPDEDVTLPMITYPKTNYNAYKGTANVTQDREAWFNKWMAQYYNVKSITGIPQLNK